MIGTMISHYKILEKLGEGGMGVVYKAEDTKLKRTVALKFLPAHLSASDQDKARFTQEAQAASALNHPNVCTIYAIEEHDGQMFIAMEFVDGQTLREKKFSVSFKQAIDIGIQLADGLAAAHEKGIVHRDIKPENIMIRKDGIAQIMDFGLAKLRASGSKITRLTKEGSTVGTAGYMSPEQVQGQDSDHRSDIFSYGVLLYELLTGQLPFKGVHETALAYEIVNVDPPPMSSITPDIDPSLDAIVLECLEKEPNERYQSIAEVAKELRRFKRESNRSRVSRVTAVRDPGTRPPENDQPAAGQPLEMKLSVKKKSVLVFFMAVSGILFLSTLLLLVLYWRETSQEQHPVRFVVLPPAHGSIQVGQAPLISPDGLKIAFIAQDSSGGSQIWIRPISTTIATPLTGTSEATYPFWSPESRFIGFFQNGKLKKIEVTGGPAQSLADAAEGRGGAWSSAGVIIFAPSSAGGLKQVSEAGGPAVDITTLDSSRSEETHRWPCFLPDGRRYLYLRKSGDVEKTAVFLGSLDSKEYSLLLPAKSGAVYAWPGYVLYVQENSLMAQAFDAKKGSVNGQAFPVADDLAFDVNRSFGLFSASQNGSVVFGSGANSATSNQLKWYDRSGKFLGNIGPAGTHFDFSLSPDEKRVAYRKLDVQTGNHDIWILDVARQTESRFTFTQAREDDPVWAPDGSKILFDSNVDGITNLYVKISSGAGSQDLLVKSPTQNQAYDWSPDGRYILYQNNDPKTNSDLWILPLTGDHKPFPYAHTNANEDIGHFSPDGRWIAYTSSESGKFEIFVQSFPLTVGKYQVSTGGGFNPRWSKDGKEIFYVAPDRKLMAVDVRITGTSVELGIPKPLFQTETESYTSWNTYVPSRDGKRFLVNTVVGGTSEKPIMVIMNWTEGIAKK